MAQYWRLTGLQAHGGGVLELSELQLWAGGSRVDTGATITSNVPPSSGLLSTLADGSAAAAVEFPAAHVLMIELDLGADLADDLDKLVIGSGTTKDKSLRSFTVQYWDATSGWVTYPFLGAFPIVRDVAFPSANTLVEIKSGEFAYWRIVFKRWVNNGASPSNTGLVRMQELRLMDFSSTAHPTTAMTDYNAPSPLVAADSDHLSGFPGWMAFDHVLGSNASRWVSDDADGAHDRWVKISLDAAIALKEFKVTPDSHVSFNYWITDFDMEASATGAFLGEQKTVARVRGLVQADWTDGTEKTFPLSPAEGYLVGTTTPPYTTALLPCDTLSAPVDPDFSPYKTTLLRLDDLNAYRFDGLGKVEGTVKIDGDPSDDSVPDIPVRRLVRLHRDVDGALVKTAFSDSVTGDYAFLGVPMDFTYHVITFDNTHSYRAVIADGVQPVLMS